MKQNQTKVDSRLEDISTILIQYSLGNFDVQLPISEDGDDIDAIIAGVNMLGEELKDVTISRDYLSRVYNSISQMLFVADLSGIIKDVNTAVYNYTDQSEYELRGKNLFDIITIHEKHVLIDENNEVISKNKRIILNGELEKAPKVKLKCNFTTLNDVAGNPSGILLIAEDVTDKIATEKLVIRTIVDTQEKERNRFAVDLHDSLGQQLSGIRFYISALQENVKTDPKANNQFVKTLHFIDSAIVELRDICFNLMPRTLENHTLKFSLGELASKINLGDILLLKINYDNGVPTLSKAFEIACFRIVQEFLNNAIKHGKAKKVVVNIGCEKTDKKLNLLLEENGVGFDVNQKKYVKGMGLQNIKTRVESYYGSFEIKSTKGKGTTLMMEFPKAFVILR